MSNDKPDFTPDELPDFLTEGASKKDLWVYGIISELKKKTDWVVDETGAQSKKLIENTKQLIEIDKKASETNGKIATAIRDIDELKRKDKSNDIFFIEVKKLVKIKESVFSLGTSRWFWIVVGIFIFGVVRICLSPTARDLVAKIIGM